MATVEEINPEHPRHNITIVPGEKVVICRCWHSQKFPFCDGSHKQHPGRGPCAVIASAEAPAPKDV